MTVEEFENLKAQVEASQLWYEPWWMKVDWSLVGQLFIIFCLLACLFYLYKTNNLKKVWQMIGRTILGAIVLAETFFQVAKPFPTTLKNNLKQDRVIL